MLNKTIDIDGVAVEFKASAATPRIYRIKVGRDIIQDIGKLKKAYAENQVEGSEFAIADLEIFENVAYIMAKQANPSIENSVEEWLDNFNMFSIYQVLPEILALWMLNEQTQVDAKKNLNLVMTGK